MKLKETREENPMGGYTWIACVDGSTTFHRAFELGLKMFDSFRD